MAVIALSLIILTEEQNTKVYTVKAPKTFTWLPLPETLEITSVDTPNGRFYTYKGEDEGYPSATTVLSAADDSNWLEEWKARVGPDKAEQTSRIATTKGSALHDLCECYIKNQDINSKLKKTLSVVSGRFLNLVPTLNRIGPVIAAENAMISKKLKIGGRCDLIAIYKRKLTVIDYKTSAKVKNREDIESYFIQLCAYSSMFQDMYGLFIERGLIIMSVEGQKEPLLFEVNLRDYTDKLTKVINLYYEKSSKTE